MLGRSIALAAGLSLAAAAPVSPSGAVRFSSTVDVAGSYVDTVAAREAHQAAVEAALSAAFDAGLPGGAYDIKASLEAGASAGHRRMQLTADTSVTIHYVIQCNSNCGGIRDQLALLDPESESLSAYSRRPVFFWGPSPPLFRSEAGKRV